MKKQLHFIFSFLFFSFIACFSVAQDTSAVKSKNYKWGWGIQLSSPYDFTAEYLQANNGFYPGTVKDKSAFSWGLQGNHYSKHYMQRLKIGVCNRVQINNGDSTTTAGAGNIFYEKIKQNMFYFSLGIGRTARYKYINLYGGMELSYLYFGQYSHSYSYTVFQNGNYLYNGGVDVTSPGGFAIGLGSFIGCDFFLLKKFSIGAEFSVSFLYSKTGGDQPLHNWAVGYYNYSGNSTTKNSKKQIYVSNVRPFLNISYHF